MKRSYLYIFVILIVAASCGQNSGNKMPDHADTVKSDDAMEMTVPDAEKLNFTDTIHLQANEGMHFDKELFRVKAGKPLKLIFKNTGVATDNMSMAHNVVILNQDVDIADFADSARMAKAEQYIPSSLSASIIAHTKMVVGGDSDEIAFIIPKPGVYDFICSYPGHWGTMQGKIVAE
ncbi:MAG: plastocyanin/azurin family copper-binding protein [Ginsengibacter sp.]